MTIAIPTYGREQVLIDTIESVLDRVPSGTPLLVVDQTINHEAGVGEKLEVFEKSGLIKRLVLSPPSITRAMNIALQHANTRFVLFFDDDIVPEPGIVEAHLNAHQTNNVAIVAGRVIQPWQEGLDFADATNFHFATQRLCFVHTFMGCNVSIDRRAALSVGGFDENFVRVAYNFEAEFSRRMLHHGHRTLFEPSAVVHHLKVASGGTRSFGDHLKTLKPDHAVGAYYFTLRTWNGWESVKELLRRPWRAIATRHHLSRPWWIPLTLIGEGRGLLWAIRLFASGPRFVEASRTTKRRTD